MSRMFGFLPQISVKCDFSPEGANRSLSESDFRCLYGQVKKTARMMMTMTTTTSYGNDTTNETSAEPTEFPLDQQDMLLANIEVALLVVMFTVIVVGNTLALVALALRRRKLSRMHHFILHLCLSDLLVAFCHVLPQLLLEIMDGFVGGYPGDDFLCKLKSFLSLFGPTLSAYMLVVTSVDRYQAICHPLTNCSWTPRRAKIMIAVSWVVALLLSSPQLFNWSYVYVPFLGKMECWASFDAFGGAQKVYVLWVATAIFFLPLTVLIFTYTCICRTIWLNFRRKNSSPQNVPRDPNAGHHVVVGGAYRFRGKGRVEVTLPSDSAKKGGYCESSIHPRAHSVSGISRAKMKTIKLTVVVILCHVACSLPYFSAALYLTWNPPTVVTITSKYANKIVLLLFSLNSCVNPWIYLIFNENLAKTLKDLFCCRLESGAQQGSGAAVVSHSSLSDTKSAANCRTRVNLTDKRSSMPTEKTTLTGPIQPTDGSEPCANGHQHHNNGDATFGNDAPLNQDSPENNNGRCSRPFLTNNMPKAYSSDHLSSTVLAEKCRNGHGSSKSDSVGPHWGVKMRVKSTLELVCRPVNNKWKHMPNNCYGKCKQHSECDAV